MNLALSDEQEFLREAARGALSRYKTIEAAREALDGPGALPDLWPTGGRGRLARPADRRGARRRRARTRSTRCSCRGVRPRARARCRCSGLLPATAILDARRRRRRCSSDRRRRAARRVRARRARPSDLERQLDRRPAQRRSRAPRRRGDASTATRSRSSGAVAFVPDAPGRRPARRRRRRRDGQPVGGGGRGRRRRRRGRGGRCATTPPARSGT